MRHDTGGRRSFLLAMLLCVTLASPRAATAAAPVPSLGQDVTVRGTRSAYTTVTVPKNVDFRADNGREMARPSARFSGKAYGWLLEAEPLGPDAGFVGQLKMPAAEGGSVIFRMDGKNRKTGEYLFNTRVLPAGRYRLHILANGPGSVRFRLPGLRGAKAIDARRASGASAFTEVVGTVGGVAPPAYGQGATFYSDNGIQVLSFDWVHTKVQAAAHYGTCMYKGAPPADRWLPGCPSGNTTIIGLYGVTTGCCGTGYAGAWFPAGRWSYGRWYDAAGVVDRAGIFIVAIPRV